MKKRTTLSLLLLICLLGVLGLISGGWAANPPDYDKIYKATLKKWTRTADIGDAFSVRAVLWNPELVQAWVAKYGKENLLSADEETAYHLDFIQREKMSHYLVFEVTITRHGGAPLYPMNFSNNTFLTGDKGHKFSLIDYPKEFDEKIFEEATGKLYFSLYDANNQLILNPETKSLTLHLSRLSLEPSYVGQDIALAWKDPYIAPDYSQPAWKPEFEEEIVRLEERISLLQAEKKKLQENQKIVESEIESVQNKIKELKDQFGK